MISNHIGHNRKHRNAKNLENLRNSKKTMFPMCTMWLNYSLNFAVPTAFYPAQTSSGSSQDQMRFRASQQLRGY